MLYCVFQIAKMVRMLKELHAHKERTERQAMRERVAKHRKARRQQDQDRDLRQKEARKLAFRTLGKLEERNKKHQQDWGRGRVMNMYISTQHEFLWADW